MAQQIPGILQALELVHNPTTTNDTRRQASDSLEQFKSNPNAAELGFVLGGDRTQQPLVRHYGLSILEHVVRHQTLESPQNIELRRRIVELGTSVNDTDPIYIRNKIAGLWIELAKRTWALDWFDLDESLRGLWYQGNVQRDFALTVLENLSDDTFVREDSTAVLRGKDLNSALVEVFTSASDYGGGIKVGTTVQHVRAGEDGGWLRRISEWLRQYVSSPSADDKATALRALATLRSAFGWVMSAAIVSAQCWQAVCNCFTLQDEDLIVAAADALLALYGRHNLEEPEVQSLVVPLCSPSSTQIFQKVYLWSVVSVDDIDSAKYTISKKISELASLLSDHLSRFAPPAAESLDITAFLHFLINIAQHESLIVSIPAIHAWTKLLETPSWRRAPPVGNCVAPLLTTVCSRMIQYDSLPENSEEPAVVFVHHEIEIHPERHGFYLNYRRLCIAVIEWICYTHLEQALDFILSRVSTALDDIHREDASIDLANYQRTSPLSLQADAQFAVVEAAFKGFDRWQNAHTDRGGAEGQQLGQRLRQSVKAWATEMHGKYQFQDPQIRQRQIKTMVEISSRALQKDTAFAFTVLEQIIASYIQTRPEYPAYTDGVVELHSYSTSELRRLTLYHADYFATFYDQLMQKFSDLITNLKVDQKIQVDLKSVLFLIVQRAHSEDTEQQKERLWSFLRPLEDSWNSQEVQDKIVSFDTYTQSQGFHLIVPFMSSMQARDIEQWTDVENTLEGVQIQQHMSDVFYQLPLRETRVLLSLSTERLEQDSPEHKLICELWNKIMGTMLYSVLRLTSYNHKLHDPSSWPNVTAEQRPVIQRILRDRYWQSGISEGSMNEFHMKVKSSKTSLEGFASSVRARIRSNLEQCYSIIHTLGRLGEGFYSLGKLPEMIAESLLSSSATLSPHHFSIMLAMLPKLIEECPPNLRQHFLTPVMTELLLQTDSKLTSEWQNIGQKKAENHEGEDLNNEMRDDSVLRQTTYKAVNMVAAWVDPKREEQLSTKRTIVNGTHLINGSAQSIREFVLSETAILERLLVFVTHALSYKDTKTCYTMIMAAQRIIPAFALADDSRAAPVREYISSDMLRVAISCLHDGYYADYQQYYAQLIALIWLYYGLPSGLPSAISSEAPREIRPALTNTPRTVLLSLPGMSEAQVDAAGEKLVQEGWSGRPKKLRAVILTLLESVRGVRLSELGKIDTKQQQSRILDLYKQRESMGGGMQVEGNGSGKAETDLGGVAEMFG